MKYTKVMNEKIRDFSQQYKYAILLNKWSVSRWTSIKFTMRIV